MSKPRLLEWFIGWWHHHIKFENGWQCPKRRGKDTDRVRSFCQRAQGHFGQCRWTR